MKKIIALDIGGTNTRLALIDEFQQVESELIRPTVNQSAEAFASSVISIIENGVKAWDGVIGIASGLPGRIEKNGFVDALPNVGVYNLPLAKILSDHFHLPVYLRNDAEVAALAEANLGVGRGLSSLYFVTISTGAGGALTRNGHLVQSSYEIGHTLTPYRGELYEFEHLCSGTGLIRLCHLNGIEVASSKELFLLVKGKDPAVLPVYQDWIRLLSGWIKMIQELFEPSVVAFTGGVMKSAEIFWDDLKAACPGCHLEPCEFGQSAGLHGATIYGFQQIQ